MDTEQLTSAVSNTPKSPEEKGIPKAEEDKSPSPDSKTKTKTKTKKKKEDSDNVYWQYIDNVKKTGFNLLIGTYKEDSDKEDSFILQVLDPRINENGWECKGSIEEEFGTRQDLTSVFSDKWEITLRFKFSQENNQSLTMILRTTALNTDVKRTLLLTKMDQSVALKAVILALRLEGSRYKGFSGTLDENSDRLISAFRCHVPLWWRIQIQPKNRLRKLWASEVSAFYDDCTFDLLARLE